MLILPKKKAEQVCLPGFINDKERLPMPTIWQSVILREIPITDWNFSDTPEEVERRDLYRPFFDPEIFPSRDCCFPTSDVNRMNTKAGKIKRPALLWRKLQVWRANRISPHPNPYVDIIGIIPKNDSCRI